MDLEDIKYGRNSENLSKKHEQIYFDLKMNHCTFYITVKSLAMVKKKLRNIFMKYCAKRKYYVLC